MSTSDYQVGYGKPPVETQFQPGQSGNPAGRPKGTVRLNDIVTAELNSLITVQEHGSEKSISKLEAMVKSLVAEAIKGDVQAGKAVLKLAPAAEEEAFRAQSEYDMKNIKEAYRTAREILRKHSEKPRCPTCGKPGYECNDKPDASVQDLKQEDFDQGVIK